MSFVSLVSVTHGVVVGRRTLLSSLLRRLLSSLLRRLLSSLLRRLLSLLEITWSLSLLLH
jgi:hypothetical protein